MLSKGALRFLALATCVLTTEVPAAEATAQDVQVIGRAISFKEGRKRGTLSLAIIYDGGSGRSQSEMRAVAGIVGAGLRVGDSMFKAVPVEQSSLSSVSGFDGVFSMSDVDQGRLRSALNGRGVPCFTLDAQQVRNGACTVAVRSRPAVSISISAGNAAAAGVRFATAFLMMVREI